MNKPKTLGFTLIELMIVVGIIGILAAIAIPNFIRYQLKSKTTEGKTVVGGIRVAQESFRAEIDNYANITSVQPDALPGTIKVDWGAFLCPTACDRTATSDNCLVFDCIGYQPSGLVYYRYKSPHRAGTQFSSAEFAIGAQADLDADTTMGNYAYRSANQMNTTSGMVSDGLSTCATNIDAYIITDCDPGTF